jgi:hypothetical protein
VVIPAECVADRAEVPHQVNLFDMEMTSSDVLPLREVVAHLESCDRGLYAPRV